MLFSSVSSNLILKLAIFATLHGFHPVNNSTVIDNTICDAPNEFKIIYLKEHPRGQISVITENGEIKEITNYLLIENK